MKPKFANAVKAFIVKDNKVLLIKRRADDVHRPGEWDTPGGRLEWGENPFLGLKREINEETKLKVEIIMPTGVHYFTREDGQKIHLTIFWCHLLTQKITLSHEHVEYRWVDLNSPKSYFPDWLHKDIETFKTYIKP